MEKTAAQRDALLGKVIGPIDGTSTKRQKGLPFTETRTADGGLGDCPGYPSSLGAAVWRSDNRGLLTRPVAESRKIALLRAKENFPDE